MIQTLRQAQGFLTSLIVDPPRPYSERAALAQSCIRQILQGVGNPHHGQRIIHIAGSKGKGSTALFAESILRTAGLRVGSFTSPHLQRWTERLRIDGCEIESQQFVQLVERLRPLITELQALTPQNTPTFFDVLTAMALLLFREMGVDVSIVETGLGGRLDSTNIVQPAVSCITALELEHTDKLGASLTQIANEKAGIIKPDTPVVVGELPPEGLAVIEARGRARGSKLIRLGKEFEVESGSVQGRTTVRITCDTQVIATTLSVMGEHFASDAALAAVCVRQLGNLEDDAWVHACETGLSRAMLPGRVEIIHRQPWVVIDSSHTQDSAAALARVLNTLAADRYYFVVSFSGRKNLEAIGARLFPTGCSVIVTEAEPTRSISPSEIAHRLGANSAIAHIHIEPDPVRACVYARSRVARGDLLCATGSAYMAGVARRVLAPRQAERDACSAPGPTHTQGAPGTRSS